ncbi:LacI family transcriptional regulator [Glycomyces buryatensis]|uniref:LacI family transcriptional regulator n=1 Tax=Glycomyces buryatensis TaxID=2570927 RepID=A0A4S8QB41_9ACTN|nr:LacI family transcriptional regulator [Glycomyces buryatensis]
MARGTVTMSDVAELAGVSKMTVSNVVNDRPGVSGEVRERVLKAIRKSGYRLNVSARTLKSGRTGVIGLAVPEVDRPYFGLLAAQVIAEADRRGFHVAVEQTGAAIAGELDAIAQSHRLQFDGLILSAVGFDPRTWRLPSGDLPLVMLGEQDLGMSIDHVMMPNEEGTEAATGHLVEAGCRKIAIVTGASGDEDTNASSRRYKGYLSALERHGLTPDPALRVTAPGWDLEGGRAAGHRLAEAGAAVDGVVAVTDTVAQGVLRGLADKGVRVPDQVRLIGFDDIPEAAYMTPSLSTVAPDHQWMAAKAVELVAARIADPDREATQHTAPYAIMARETTR